MACPEDRLEDVVLARVRAVEMLCDAAHVRHQQERQRRDKVPVDILIRQHSYRDPVPMLATRPAGNDGRPDRHDARHTERTTLGGV